MRKTTAQVKTTTSKRTSTTQSDKFDFEWFFKKIRDGMDENWMTYVGFILVIIGIIQLRQFIVGIAFLTIGILLIAGFFGNNNTK